MERKLKTWLAAVALAGLALAPARADPLDDAISAYAQGDYASALKILRPLAEHGDAKAQFRLGFMYDSGQGVPRDQAEAAKWYRKAGDQGVMLAQDRLGVMYLAGQGVAQDFAESTAWFRKASDQGDDNAQWQLGDAYAEGRGIAQDNVAAYMWYSLVVSRSPQSDFHDLAAPKRETLAGKMTPDQIAKAQKLASDWKPNK
ncbi:MAG TPA: tetratricopeptide repeat protein [Stellaceae bacterium]|nr:tetratricopeptide repeat protein [Stellaceae bacterium]